MKIVWISLIYLSCFYLHAYGDSVDDACNVSNLSYSAESISNHLLRNCCDRRCRSDRTNFGYLRVSSPPVPISLTNTETRVVFNFNTSTTRGCIRMTESGGLSLPRGTYRINYEVNIANTSANEDQLTFWIGSKPRCGSVITPVSLSERQVFIPAAGPLSAVPVLGTGFIYLRIAETTTLFLSYETKGLAALQTLPPILTSSPAFGLEAFRLGP